jgi:superfamily II DNA or RNA helicase
MDYQDFLSTKLKKVKPSGFVPDSLPDYLFDYQAYIVNMALIKGRFAIFANTGTGKTSMQLAWANEVFKHTNRPVLIVAPLAVAKQTAYDESAKFGVKVQYCKDQSDVVNGINITNYEKLSKFDCDTFIGVVLDESSLLKSFTGATCQALIESFIDTPYKLACSATPSPNDHMELGNHAEFLGIMSRTEMLAQYFTHDSSDTSKWRLKHHGQQPFWKWLSEWSIMIQKSSDLGFSDDNYQLPPLNETDIYIQTDLKREGELLPLTATGLSEQRQIKKQTVQQRVAAIANLVNGNDDQWLVWCETNEESALLKAAIDGAVEVKGSDKDSHKEQSAHDFAHGTIRVLVSKPSIFGFGLNFQSCHNIAFVSLSNSFEMTYQAIRRCYRFGQTQPVNVYYAVTDTCGSIKANIERKQAQFEEMFSQLVKYMGQQTMVSTISQKNEYDASEWMILPNFI